MESRRYDGKLDNFLLQSLSEDEYERIATSELCVVVCPEEKPAHKHVIVGHQHLYMTQFPPKNLKIAVHLEDVTSIRMLDDLPDFLSGKEREGTTHVQIKYRRTAGKEAKGLLKAAASNLTISPSPSSSPSPSPKLLRNGLTRKSPGQPSPLSTLTRTSPEERNHGRSPAATNTTIVATTTRFNGGGSTPHTSPPHFFTSSPPGDPSTPSPNNTFSTEGSSSSDLYPRTVQGPSPRTPKLTPGSAHGGQMQQKLNTGVGADLHGNSRKPPSKHQVVVVVTGNVPSPSLEGRALPPTPPSPAASLLVPTSPSPSSLRYSGLATSSISLASSTSSSTSSSCPDLTGARHTPLFIRGGGDNPPPPPSSPSPSSRTSTAKRSGSLPRGSTLSLAPPTEGSTLSLAPPTEGTTTTRAGVEEVVLDLYVLKQNTDFYNQTLIAWENYKIASTLKANTTKTTSTSQSHDHFSRHFCALKSELLSPLLTPQGCDRLLLELSTACQKYFVLKTLFWENAELINFCANQLDINVLSASINGRTAESLKHRAILLDAIYQVMGGSHMCPRRMTSFVSNGGLLLYTLATTTVQHFPSQVDAQDLHNVLIEKSCGVLFELLRVAQQAKRSVVCVSWLVEKLASLTNMKYFCSSVVTYITNQLGGTEVTSGELPASCLVGLYHAAFVVNTLVHESPALFDLFCSNFAEEFRYYISISGAQHHLPPNYPLRTDTLELLHNAKKRVLNQGKTATGLN
ncbi:hypothetical protein EMCRGX_G002090 [Ephydatia muelleri]